jgi:hypothetical protein
MSRQKKKNKQTNKHIQINTFNITADYTNLSETVGKSDRRQISLPSERGALLSTGKT